MKQSLLIFAKNEVFGKVKTRLADTLGNERALDVYQKLLKHTCTITKALPVHKIVFYSDYIEQQDLWSSTQYQKRVQQGEDLGLRMRNAFANVLDEGADRAVIIGTDCPDLSSGIIMEAFDKLNIYDIVIGPAKDGGYYLLAMKGLNSDLFYNIDWSTDLVLKQTLDICKSKKLSVHLLPVLADIDREEDLNSFGITLIHSL